MTALGAQRPQVARIVSSTGMPERDETIVGIMSCENMNNKKLASQAGATPFGVAKTSPDPAKSERQLVRWNTPRAAAVAAELTNASIGRRRGELVQVAAGHSRRITVQERRRSESILPRLSDGRINTNTDGTGVGGVCVHWHAHSQYLQAGIQGYHAYRQVTTKVNGGDTRTQDQIVASKKSNSWMTGQSFQSQSRTGGFQKIRDVAKNSFYPLQPYTSHVVQQH